MKAMWIDVKSVCVKNKFDLYLDNIFKEESRATRFLEEESHSPVAIKSDGSFFVRKEKNADGKDVYQMIYGHALWNNVLETKQKRVYAVVYGESELSDEQAFELNFNKDLQSGYAKYRMYERAFAVARLHGEDEVTYNKATLARIAGVSLTTINKWLLGVQMYDRIKELLGKEKVDEKIQWTHVVDIAQLAKTMNDEHRFDLSDSAVCDCVAYIIDNDLSTNDFKAFKEKYLASVQDGGFSTGSGSEDQPRSIQKAVEASNAGGDELNDMESPLAWDDFDKQVPVLVKNSPVGSAIQVTPNANHAFDFQLFLIAPKQLKDVEALFASLHQLANRVVDESKPVAKPKKRKAA